MKASIQIRAEDTAEEDNSALALGRREHLLVALFLLCAMLLLTHFVHQAWDFALGVALSQRASDSKRYAPDVYRVLIPTLVRWLTQSLPGHHPATAYSLLDFCFGYATVFCGYLLTVSGLNFNPALRAERATRVAFYLASVQFPLAWVVPYQRPETLPSALYLVLATLLLKAVGTNRAWAMVLLALTLFQALVRSDVACIFGVAVFLLSLAGTSMRSIAPRAVTAALGLGIACIALGVQAYLQLVRFPHMTYPPGTVTVMAGINLRPHFFTVLCLVMLPLLCMVMAAFALKVRLAPLQILPIVAAALYLPLWFTVGSVTEVRIFVPFLLLLCPTAATVLAAALLPNGTAATPRRAS
ncbi:MAG: hypothetical protein ACRYF4_06670 [Janthinobacterium lividum]